MKNFKFNTDGNKKEIATIIEQELEARNKGSQFDVIEIDDDFGDDQCRLITVTLDETELKDDGDSFKHRIEVREIDVNEYSADIRLSY